MNVHMRCLVVALFIVAILLGIASTAAEAATVGCGRVTTFVAPNSAGALNSGDGWLIFAKPDGTSEKVILRSGSLTPSGSISGYVCVGINGIYSTGLLAPGAAGYIPEPADWVTGTGVYCGVVSANPFSTGQLSGPRRFQLTGGLNAFSGGIFSVPTSMALPTVGTYLCGRFSVGGPSELVTLLAPGDPAYLAAGLPNTSTAPADPVPALGLAMSLLVLLAVACAIARGRSA